MEWSREIRVHPAANLQMRSDAKNSTRTQQRNFTSERQHGAPALPDGALHHLQEARRMADDDIATLEQQLDDKFQEILEAVASQLKLGKYDDLSDADQERVENEAEIAADQWMDENEAGPREPKTPFEKLLSDYAAIALKFPDDVFEDDDEEEDEEEEEEEKEEKAEHEHKPHK
jgi:hypothetical protein